MRIGKMVARGYQLSDFTEICRRYIPRSEFVALEKEVEERNTVEVEQRNGANKSDPVNDVGGGI